MNPKSKDAAVVLLSGGLDSTTLLWKLEADGVVCLPLAINYGQRHSKELQHAEAIVKAMSRPSKLQIADLAVVTDLDDDCCEAVLRVEATVANLGTKPVSGARLDVKLCDADGAKIVAGKADVTLSAPAPLPSVNCASWAACTVPNGPSAVPPPDRLSVTVNPFWVPVWFPVSSSW